MAIADIAFVCSKDKCPSGYEMLLNCPCGHPANLWKKFVGAPAEERYLCFTRTSKDNKVIEDMYIPGSSERYVMKGFEVVKRTIEGEDSLNCKYLAIKRTNRNDAKNGVSNIDIYKCKNKPPSTYKKLGAKLNGLYICAKIIPIHEITQDPSQDPPQDPSQDPPQDPPQDPSQDPSHSSGQQEKPLPTYDNTSQPHQPLPTYGQPHQPLPTYGRPHQPLPTYGQPHQPLRSYDNTSQPHQPHQPLPTTNNNPIYHNPGPKVYTSDMYNVPLSVQPMVPNIRQSMDQSDHGGLLLGFENLDLDQPIEFNQTGEFEDTPPGSPVIEHFTMEESHDLSATAPSLYNQSPGPPAPSPGTPGPYNQSPGHSPGPYNQSPGPYNHQPPGPYTQPPGPYNQPPGPYNHQPPGPYTQPPPGPYTQPSGPYNQPPGPYNQPPGPYNHPPGPYNHPSGPYNQPPGPYSTQPSANYYRQQYSPTPQPMRPTGYPQAGYQSYNQPPNHSQSGSSNIGFNI